MRRTVKNLRFPFSLLPLLAFLLLACAITTPTVSPAPSPVPPTALPSPTPTPTPTPLPTDLYITAADVILYPVPDLYSGDLVTFDVTLHNLGQINPYDVHVGIYHQTPDRALGEGIVGYPAFDGVPRARVYWAWDTAGLEGEQSLLVWADPDDLIQEGDEDPENNVVTITVQIHPADERPSVEVGATWATTTTDCCIFHYLTGTAAERDLSTISAVAEEAMDHVESQLHATMSDRFEIYLISRVIGHGGYARGWFALSYLDRHYAGSELEPVLRHEATHSLDLVALTDWAPAIMREGLAVMVAGGHFKPEPIPERAAALLELDWYIPLDELADDFYRHQHEIGYLEAAAFVTYLLETHGWDGFLRFYTALDPSHGTDPEVLNAALVETFGAGLAATEEDFLRWLEAHPPLPEHVLDLQNTVRLFDTIRRYQEIYEPSAYFWSGWLPNPAEAESWEITTDFLRHPRAPENVALETMLIAAQDALVAGDFTRTEALLDAVEDVLARGAFADPLAAEYLAVVQAVAAAGYEAQGISLEGRTARVQAIADWPDLVELRLSRTAAGWMVSD